MTVEELDIIVNASVEKAIKEFEKLVPSIKKVVKEVTEKINSTDFSSLKTKTQQAVQFVKTKIENLVKSSKNNEIAIKVNNKEASKQISQIQKEIDSLQKKISERQMKLNLITPRLDEITSKTTKVVTPDGVSPNNSAIQKTINNTLASNKEYNTLLAQENKITQEIVMYNKQLDIARSKMAQLSQQTSQTATTQNKLSSYFNAFKGKIEQAKTSTKGLKNIFNQMPKITQNITNNVKNITGKMKQGLGQVLKYAGALLSLRGIYSILSNCANAWLSSQNAQAQQLSSNIEYMKYAMGSVFAPVIEYITNLVYNLMKAIQSLVYAFSGINIFAKATASSMNKTAGSAKQASKSLAGVHNEINNVSENNNSGSGGSVAPSIDLSKIDNTPNSIVEAIKNGDWYKIGETIGKKLNEAMNSIPWNKIQNTARKIGKGTAELLNGFIAETDWNQVGNTFAQGINTIIYTGYEFVTTFDWANFGTSMGKVINEFFKNTDWKTAGETFSNGIVGILTSIDKFLDEVDWKQIGESIKIFLINIDWDDVFTKLATVIGKALGGLVQIIIGLFGDYWSEQWEKFEKYGEECGGNIILGIAKGFLENIGEGWKWAWEHLAKPLVEGFCEVLGIHSPSTVFAEFGKNIVQGLVNGISSLVEKITEIWNNMKNIAIEKFNNIKESITNKVIEIKNGISQKVQEAYNNIRNIFGNIGSFFSNIWRKSKKYIFKFRYKYR